MKRKPIFYLILLGLGMILSHCSEPQNVKLAFQGQGTSNSIEFQCSGEIVDDVCIGASIACDGEVVDGVCTGTTIECIGEINSNGQCIGKTIQCKGEIIDGVCHGETIQCSGVIKDGVCIGDTITCDGEIVEGVCKANKDQIICDGVVDPVTKICRPDWTCPGVIVDKVCQPEPPMCDESKESDFCLELKDDFERNVLLDQAPFAWHKLVFDTGKNGSRLDARLARTDAKAGNLLTNTVASGKSAVMFTGRDGGSVHEIYLISKPFNLKNYKKVTIQFDYAHLSLDAEKIFLKKNGNSVAKHEQVRLDICAANNDTDCGLNKTGQISLTNTLAWDSFYPEIQESIEFGAGVTNLNVAKRNWKKANVTIDLSQYKGRKEKFVFRIVATMDEGFKNNKIEKTLEDGILVDRVILAGHSK